MPASDLTAKTIKGETPPNLATDEASKSSPRDTIAQTSSSNPTIPVHEPFRPFHSPAPVGAPFVAKRFKLDNRPTAFRVVPPLPSGLGDVSYTFLNIRHTYFSAWGKLFSISLLFSEMYPSNGYFGLYVMIALCSNLDDYFSLEI